MTGQRDRHFACQTESCPHKTGHSSGFCMACRQAKGMKIKMVIRPGDRKGRPAAGSPK